MFLDAAFTLAMVDLSRRQLLKSILVSAAAGSAGLTGLRGYFSYAAAVPAPPGHTLIVGTWSPSVCAVDLATREVRSVPLNFQPHSMVQNPRVPHQFWVIEKWGPNTALVDFREKKIIHSLTVPPGGLFAGHGSVSLGGDILYITRADAAERTGHLVGYDTGKGKQVSDHQITPGSVHQCSMMSDGKLLVANSGWRPDSYVGGAQSPQGVTVEHSSISRVDPRDGTILSRHFIYSERQGVNHFAVMADGAIVGLSTAGQGRGTVFVSQGGMAPFKEVEWPDDIRERLGYEMLSVAVNDDAHVAVVTNPTAKLVLFLDTRDGRYLGRVEKIAYGVSFDPEASEFICSGTELFMAGGTELPDGTFPVASWLIQEGIPAYAAHSLLVPRVIYT